MRWDGLRWDERIGVVWRLAEDSEREGRLRPPPLLELLERGADGRAGGMGVGMGGGVGLFVYFYILFFEK